MTPNGKSEYDVFISYSDKDSDWVRTKLLPRLEAHGVSILVDFRDFRTGGFSVEEMERAVSSSRRVVLVLSEAYFESNWTKFENVMAQTEDPGAVERKIIPVLRATCQIPLRLRVMVYRDLRTEDEQQWKRLIRDLE